MIYYTEYQLCDFDKKLLLDMYGVEQKDLKWGAAMSVSVEYLRSIGYVKGYTDITLTDKGKKYIEENLL